MFVDEAYLVCNFRHKCCHRPTYWRGHRAYPKSAYFGHHYGDLWIWVNAIVFRTNAIGRFRETYQYRYGIVAARVYYANQPAVQHHRYYARIKVD